MESKFEEIENIISKLEDNEIGLEEAFKLYNNAMKLVKECSEAIDKVEKELVVLAEN